MSSRSNRLEAVTPASTLWLEVTFGAVRRVFELAGSDDRAIVVGSMPRADIPISTAGVAPVHFHFERDDVGICLVPDAAGDLRLDTIRVLGPRQLPAHARVDLAGVQLLIRVLGEAPDLTDVTLTTSDPVGVDYFDALPTVTADTAAFPTYGSYGTEIVRRSDLGSLEPFAEATQLTSRVTVPSDAPTSPATGVEVTSVVPIVSPPQIAAPLCVRPTPPSGDTTAFETPAFPVSQSWRKESGGHASLLVTIGSSAKRHPMVVGVGTVLAGLVIAAALASLPRAPNDRRASPAARSPAIVPGVHAIVPPRPNVAPLAEVGARSTQRGAADSEVHAAVDALFAGRVADARRAYAVLAERPEKDPALVVLARLLARAVGPQCAAGSVLPKSCPEVKR